MLRIYGIAALASGFCGQPAFAAETALSSVSGTWALEQASTENAYVLASRGAVGDYLICFDAGNVRLVTVAVGEERSVLSRGSCTVFAPTGEDGIIVGFAEAEGQIDRPIALGSFKWIVRQSEIENEE